MGKGRKTSTTRSDTPPDEADAGWRGRRVQVALASLAALFLAAGGAFAWWQDKRATEVRHSPFRR